MLKSYLDCPQRALAWETVFTSSFFIVRWDKPLAWTLLSEIIMLFGSFAFLSLLKQDFSTLL